MDPRPQPDMRPTAADGAATNVAPPVLATAALVCPARSADHDAPHGMARATPSTTEELAHALRHGPIPPASRGGRCTKAPPRPCSFPRDSHCPTSGARCPAIRHLLVDKCSRQWHLRGAVLLWHACKRCRRRCRGEPPLAGACQDFRGPVRMACTSAWAPDDRRRLARRQPEFCVQRRTSCMMSSALGLAGKSRVQNDESMQSLDAQSWSSDSVCCILQWERAGCRCPLCTLPNRRHWTP